MVRYYAAQGHAAYDEYHTLNLKDNGVDKLWVILTMWWCYIYIFFSKCRLLIHVRVYVLCIPYFK